MIETLFSSAFHNLCTETEGLYRDGRWKDTHEDFNDYVAWRWGVPKTHVVLWRRFFKFCGMCREARVRIPEAPGIVKGILSRKQSHWLDLWSYCINYADGPITPGHVDATISRFANADDKKPPQHVLDRRNAKRGLTALARISDVRNVRQYPPEAREGVDKAIELEEQRMNSEAGYE